jgi:choline monooxygenase
MISYYVDKDISLAKTIHKSVYTDAAVFEKLRNQIFPRTWQYTSCKDEVNDLQNIYPTNFIEGFIDEPLIVVKNQDKYNTLSNVCTHRGNLLKTEACKSDKFITCKYHGRRFSLDGEMLYMPEFKEVKDFPSAHDHLHTFLTGKWGNWLFASLDKRKSFEEYFKPMLERLSWIPIDEYKYRPEYGKDYYINANWALYCENYLEGFHIPFVHEGLNSVIDYGTYETIPDGQCVLQIGYAKDDEMCFHLPEASIDYGKNIAAYYYWFFPNIMFNFYPWGLSLNIVKPIAVNKTKVSFLVFIQDESKYNHGAGSDLDKVELEDEEIVQNVQRGLHSRIYQYGRYSVTREQGTHHFHRLLAEALNEH